MGEISEESRMKILAQCSVPSVDIATALRDVVERNQAFENCWLYVQAADEIDRLRKLNMLLAEAGLQVKLGEKWSPLPTADGFYRGVLDTGRWHQ